MYDNCNNTDLNIFKLIIDTNSWTLNVRLHLNSRVHTQNVEKMWGSSKRATKCIEEQIEIFYSYKIKYFLIITILGVCL